MNILPYYEIVSSFIKKVIDFVARPTQSRTMGLAVMLILVVTVSLTVYVAQQQQQLKQRAAAPEANCTVTFEWANLIEDSALNQGPPFTVTQDTLKRAGPDVSQLNPVITSNTQITFNDILPGQYGITLCDKGGPGISRCTNLTNDAVCSTSILIPNITLELSCQDKSTVKWTVKTTGESDHMNLFLTRNGNEVYSKNDWQSPFSGTGLEGTYNVRIYDPNTNKELASKTQDKYCSTFPPDSTDSTTPNLPLLDNECSTDWQDIGTCGQLGCPENSVPQFKECPGKVAENRCVESTSCATPTPTPSPTITPTPTSPPASVTLTMSINAQDVPLASDNLSVNLSLYNLTTNSPVSGLGNKVFAKTPIPGKQYAANISLTNLISDKYFVIARKDNMIAKSVFTASSVNDTITVPTTTLVFGDLNNDNDINILDHDNIFKACWKKEAKDSCVSTDFDKNGKIDQIDYNTFLRGFATWQKQGQNL